MLAFIKNRKQSHTHTHMCRNHATTECWYSVLDKLCSGNEENYGFHSENLLQRATWERCMGRWGVGRINHNHHHYQCHPHVINTLEEQTSLFMPFLFLPSNLYMQLPHEAKTMLKWFYIFIYYSVHIQEDESHLLVSTCSACMLFRAMFGHICIAAFAHTMLLASLL